MTDVLNPYTDEQLTDMEEGIKLANLTEKGINKAISAGLDTGDQLEKIREARTKLQQILTVYRK